MAISMQKAQALCTQSELNLVKWSSPKQVKTLSPAQLRQKIERARKLRDKFKDLSRKQAGEARGKRKPTGTRAAKGNDRTVEKRELFDEVIARFDKALEHAAADGKKSTKKKATTKKAIAKPTSKKKSAKTGASRKKASAVPKAASTTSRKKRPVTLSSDGSGSSSLLSGFGASLAEQQSRETRRQQASKSSKGGRERNRLARTSREKIQGHVSSSTRRSQAKRDSK